MRNAKEIFEEELSGEPLTQVAVIEAIEIALDELRREFIKELREIRLRNA